mmetsp:Transcript_34718/g.88033  ORF Transcript_34718/g.88033 Transcript_34718/m.88033 type:complete len:84 (-) Transcript_34718:393-644(-)
MARSLEESWVSAARVRPPRPHTAEPVGPPYHPVGHPYQLLGRCLGRLMARYAAALVAAEPRDEKEVGLGRYLGKVASEVLEPP